MLVHPQFDPVALQLGPIAIHWYGLMYLVAFAQVILLGRWCIAHRPWSGWSLKMLDDALFYGVLGTIVGGRLGYVLFYKPMEYLAHPLDMLQSVGRRHELPRRLSRRASSRWPCSRATTSCAGSPSPISSPRWCRWGSPPGASATSSTANCGGAPPICRGPWCSRRPATALRATPRSCTSSPAKACCCSLILWLYSSKPRPVGAISGVFLIGYGSFRFLAEFAREPDSFLGLLGLGLSMGQWLSLPMVITGVAMLRWARRASGQQPS